MEDMGRLIQGRACAGDRVVLDLVLNHASDEHEWVPPCGGRRAAVPGV